MQAYVGRQLPFSHFHNLLTSLKQPDMDIRIQEQPRGRAAGRTQMERSSRGLLYEIAGQVLYGISQVQVMFSRVFG
jgi:hypothetical protein